MSVQWYPGHMAKAMRRIAEYVALVDIVVEVIDARVPRAGRNPALHRLTRNRARVIVLNREDLADGTITRRWLERFAAAGFEAIATDGRAQPSVKRVAEAMKRVGRRERGRARALVVGLPNSGKSSIINGLLRRAAAKTEDRAGVTRQLQWFRLPPDIEVMDTPGILVPKIADADAQWKLALVGAVPLTRFDPEAIAESFHRWVDAHVPGAAVPDLAAFAQARGFARRGGEIDLHTAARVYLRAAGDGLFGRFSFEMPDDAPPA